MIFVAEILFDEEPFKEILSVIIEIDCDPGSFNLYELHPGHVSSKSD